MSLLKTAIKIHARITYWASTKAQVGAKFLFHNKTCGSWNYFRLLKTMVEFLRTLTRWIHWKEGSSLWSYFFHIKIKVHYNLCSCNQLLDTSTHNWANAGRRKNSLTILGNIRITTSITIRWWFIAAPVFQFICFKKDLKQRTSIFFSLSCRNYSHFQVNICLNNVGLSDIAWYQQPTVF